MKPSTTEPTRRRAKASDPPPKEVPTPRMTTNALAHASIVTAIAVRTPGVSAVTRAGFSEPTGFIDRGDFGERGDFVDRGDAGGGLEVTPLR